MKQTKRDEDIGQRRRTEVKRKMTWYWHEINKNCLYEVFQISTMEMSRFVMFLESYKFVINERETSVIKTDRKTKKQNISWKVYPGITILVNL